LESPFTIKKIIFAFCLLVSGCTTCDKTNNRIAIPPVDFRNGDIICRLGNGYFSKYFRNYSSKEKLYSHSGILEIASDTIFVIHIEASELTGIGFVKREDICSFLDGIKTWGIYRITDEDYIQSGITHHAKSYYHENIPFDLDFDLSDDTKLYCTELVACSVNKAFEDSIIKPTLTLKTKLFYGIDDIYNLPFVETIYKTDAVTPPVNIHK